MGGVPPAFRRNTTHFIWFKNQERHLGTGTFSASSVAVTVAASSSNKATLNSVGDQLRRWLKGQDVFCLWAFATLDEIAPKGWRNRYAAFTYVFSGASFLLASIIGLLGTEFLDHAQMQAYGWRVAFVIGGLVGVYGIFARLRLTESEEFEELQGESGDGVAPARERHPLWSRIRNHPGAVLLVFGFTMMMTLLYYALTVSFASYAVDDRGMDSNTVYWVTTIGTVVFIALQYPCGWLADRFGRRPQLIVSAVLFMVGIVPLTSMVSDSFWGLLALFTLCMAVYAPMSAIAPVVYADLFPANIRGTGLGTWYNISVALFGGTVSLVLTALTAAGAENMFFWYIALACAVWPAPWDFSPFWV